MSDTPVPPRLGRMPAPYASLQLTEVDLAQFGQHGDLEAGRRREGRREGAP